MHPERRKHVRILTITNFGRAAIVLLVVLAAANVISELRAPKRGEYGRLVSREEPRDVAIKRVQPIVEEAPVSEAPVTPAVASLVDEPAQVVVAQPVVQSATLAAEPARRPAVTDHVTIVGGPDGIHVEAKQHEAVPKLTGGIFRQ